MTKKLLPYVVASVCCLLVIGAGLYSGQKLETGMSGSPIGWAPNGPNRTPLTGQAVESGVNIKDDKELMGLMDNAFVGKVLEKVGSERLEKDSASSQYRVDPIMNIKGDLQGQIIVSQFEWKKYPLLQVGSTYVFTVRYGAQKDIYVMGIYPENYTVLSEDASLSNTELKTLAENSAWVKRLREAYPQEVPFFGKVQNHIEYNSYASRHYDASGALIDDTVEFHKQFAATHPSATNLPADSAAPPQPANAPANNSVSSPAPSDAPTSDTASPTPSNDATAPTAPPATDLPAPTPIDSPAPAAS